MPRHATKTSFKKGAERSPETIQKWREAMDRKKAAGWKRRDRGMRSPNALPIGSRRVTKHGYVQVKVDPSGRWAYEHRWNWELANGRPLTRGEVVHHIDGNRQNNDPANLQVMTHRAHSSLTATIHTSFRHPKCPVCGWHHPPH